MSGDAPQLSDDAARLLQRRAHARRDLEELATQVADGEIDEATADQLRAGYEQELADVEAALDAAAGVGSRKAAPPSQAVEPDAPRGVSPRRAVIGAGALVAAFTVAIVFIGGDTVPSRQGAAAGPTAESTPAPATGGPEGPVSVEQLESVVAANPEVLGMRLALANLYFDQQQYSAALPHYLAILEAEPNAAEESIALGRVGWMAFVTDQNDAAEQYLRRSLEVDPTYVEGKLFLGYLLFHGLDEPGEAVPLLEEVLTAEGLTPEVRADVEGTLAIARERAAGGGG